MIGKVLEHTTSFVIAGPEFAQQITGEALGLGQLRVKTFTNLTNLKTVQNTILQAFNRPANESSFEVAIQDWMGYHGTLKLLLILDVRGVTSKDIEWGLDALENVRRRQERLILFTCFDQEERDLMFGSVFTSRSTYLGNFLS